MAVSVDIADSVLAWIISKVRPESLPEAVWKNLMQWRNKEKAPTFNQVEAASKATGIPLGYFFLQTPPQENLSLVDYRTVDSVELTNPSRELLDTIHDMEFVQDWMHNELIANGFLGLAFVGTLKNEKDPIIFAATIRKILCITNDWFKASKSAGDSFKILRSAMSAAGMIVMTSGIVGNNTRRTLDINEFRGFALMDTLAPLIFINANDSDNGRLFSLLHEFAHICLGENSLFNDRYTSGKGVKDKESICNAVAAEILIPQAVFVEAWHTAIKEADVEEVIGQLAKDFKCGRTVIARRALDNGFIDYPLYEKIAKLAIEIYNKWRSAQKEKGGGGQFYSTLKTRIDPRFLKMLTSSVTTGRTLYTDAYRLTNTNRFTFEKLTNPSGGEI